MGLPSQESRWRGMSRYLNRDERTMVLSVLASAACAAALREEGTWGEDVTALAAKAAEELNICAEMMVEGVEQDQMRAMLNLAENTHLSILPKQAAKAAPGKEWVIVEKEVIDRITENSLFDCSICTKEGKEVKKCKLRRDLIACDIEPRSAEGCPYQGW